MTLMFIMVIQIMHDEDKSLITESVFLFFAWSARWKLSVASRLFHYFPVLHSSPSNVFISSICAHISSDLKPHVNCLTALPTSGLYANVLTHFLHHE